jgi:hypothetical protein
MKERQIKLAEDIQYVKLAERRKCIKSLVNKQFAEEYNKENTIIGK